MSVLLDVRNVRKTFPVRKGVLQRVVAEVVAIDDVSLTLERGRTLGLVGESGCGKSTLAKMLVGLYPPSEGDIIFDGKPLDVSSDTRDLDTARKVQIVFQDPFSSLDPRIPIGASVAEGRRIHNIGDVKSDRQATVDILDLVGLSPQCVDRYPHEFSGGQRQRIGIARALMMKPDLLICDEPTSALDVSVQAQILNLLKRLQNELNLTLLFISHNLAVVRHVADDVMVMYLGRAVEIAPVEELFANPRHPYTRALLSATPIADPERRGERIKLAGELPSPINPPSGCAFHPRCPIAFERCSRERPDLESKGGVKVACWALDEHGETMQGAKETA
ncbi:MAG: ABC transporter ATP-binding protein [Alphaproteobacteria bacterium]